jgi:hypothetical protein
MAIISLPLLDEDAPVSAAIDAMRKAGVGGVVSFGASSYWLHSFKDLAASARQDATRSLARVDREKVTELAPLEAAANNLSFTQPNPALFANYLRRQNLRHIVTAAVRGPSGIAFVALSRPELQNLNVYPTAWFCPDDSNEVWEDYEKPSPPVCPKHRVDLKPDR